MMNTRTPIESLPVSSELKIKVMAILVLVISTGFVWMATDQTIAPPIVRTMDLIWRLFVCRCFFQFDLLQ